MSKRHPNTAPSVGPPVAGFGPVDPDLSTPPARKRRHVFRWVFAAVQILFLVWIITGASSGSSTPSPCQGMVGQALQTCRDAGQAGTVIGVGLIIGLWAAVDVILALCWLIFRKRA